MACEVVLEFLSGKVENQAKQKQRPMIWKTSNEQNVFYHTGVKL